AAVGVIALEASLALLFVIGIAVEPALIVAALTLSTFAVAVGINLHRRRPIACGCLGQAKETISMRSLVRLGMLLAVVVAAAAITASAGTVTLKSLQVAGATELLESATLAAALLAIGSWVLHAPELKAITHAHVERRQVSIGRRENYFGGVK
ncbi:MAG TPA: MauE/DoxX family redox-associated membrane protein, partial [Planctomycetaceae bacterium]|nr:MauE/DoxX family redox-associated membrane protein [Planctomycetaceae bacterium]